MTQWYYADRNGHVWPVKEIDNPSGVIFPNDNIPTFGPFDAEDDCLIQAMGYCKKEHLATGNDAYLNSLVELVKRFKMFSEQPNV